MTLGRGNQWLRKLPKKRQTVNAAKLSQQRKEQKEQKKVKFALDIGRYIWYNEVMKRRHDPMNF